MPHFLLSDTANLQPILHQSLKQQIDHHGNRMAYISAEPQLNDRPYFHSTINDYHKIAPNINKIDYFDLSAAFSDTTLEAIREYPIIHLSGGNTCHFLRDIKARELLTAILKAHIEQNKLLIGVSAGALVLTPTIKLADDENDIGLTSFFALNHVPFEFLPHYTNDPVSLDELRQYSKTSTHIIYAAHNTSGISVKNGQVTPLGKVYKMTEGFMQKL
jgi:dipeptidase E